MTDKKLDFTKYTGTRADSLIDDNIRILKMLKWPERAVDVVIDTDTYNEIDDQYALVYALRSEDRMSIKAIYAAPFDNEKSGGPEKGMELSFNEIMKVLKLSKHGQMMDKVYRGSRQFMTDNEPVESDAAKDLVDRAKAYSEDNPLYVIGLGAITNIASALLMDPSIINRIVLIWLGGHSFEWNSSHEFNMFQDVNAARVVFDSKVPLVLIPCVGVTSSLTTSKPELEYWLRDKSELCNYLIDITIEEAKRFHTSDVWTRPIWDVSAIAWLVNKDYLSDRIEHAPIAEYDDYYSFDHRRHLIRYVDGIRRDLVFADLFKKLAR